MIDGDSQQEARGDSEESGIQHGNFVLMMLVFFYTLKLFYTVHRFAFHAFL